MKLLIFMLFASCVNQESMFFDKVLNDFDGNTFFISVDIYSSGYNGKIIIENDELYYCLNKTKQIEKEGYLKSLRETLKNHSPLEIEDMVNCKFFKVVNVPTVETNAKKGLNEFIKTYFNKGKILKDGITDDERTAIIEKLFEWQVASKIDDETGYLVISR